MSAGIGSPGAKGRLFGPSGGHDDPVDPANPRAPMPAVPVAMRPWMPGYGTLPADQGTGLLPWSWAEQRLRDSHDYWLPTSWPDGRPHVMPVWGMWLEGALWFSSSRGSRKARNLRARAHCVGTTDQPKDPAVLDGHAEAVTSAEDLAG